VPHQPGAPGNTLALEVRDDGIGRVSPDAHGTGLRGMSERLRAVGGHLELRPGPGGFRLVATVPARENATVAR
jgi:signal transduction histidine kinase